MIPHERSLVKKWKGRPFVLLGVNSDDLSEEHTMKRFRAQQKAMGVNWRSFRDNGDGTGDPISKQWHVFSWPTLIYIDHLGVIRYRNVTDKEKMERALEEMISTAETAQRNK